MKKLTIIVLALLFSSTSVFSQTGEDALVLSQLFIGIDGVQQGEQVTHYINAIGPVWTKSGSNFQITTNNEVYNNSATSNGNASDSPLYNCAGFNWYWLSGGEKFGLGVYKITNSKDNTQFIYLDCRDNEWVESGTNPDLFYISYDNESNFIYQFKGKAEFNINKGQVIRPSNILSTQYKTDKLQDFWNNALVLAKSGSNKVKLIWGKHPTFTATHYKIYRAITTSPTNPALLNFSVYYTSSANTFDIIDPDFTLDGSLNYYVYYYVKAYNANTGQYSSASNTVSTNGTYAPMKRNMEDENETIISDYSLDQNYPNPFNPSTLINYSIAKDGFVSLKVYDILGNEVSTLVNLRKKKGNYSIKFDAQGLASGIYIARLVSNNFSESIKMILYK